MTGHEPLPVDPEVREQMRAFVDACDAEAAW
jgi:hypothetical protein